MHLKLINKKLCPINKSKILQVNCIKVGGLFVNFVKRFERSFILSPLDRAIFSEPFSLLDRPVSVVRNVQSGILGGNQALENSELV